VGDAWSDRLQARGNHVVGSELPENQTGKFQVPYHLAAQVDQLWLSVIIILASSTRRIHNGANSARHRECAEDQYGGIY
jgi:hypothetical protein